MTGMVETRCHMKRKSDAWKVEGSLSRKDSPEGWVGRIHRQNGPASMPVRAHRTELPWAGVVEQWI